MATNFDFPLLLSQSIHPILGKGSRSCIICPHDSIGITIVKYIIHLDNKLIVATQRSNTIILDFTLLVTILPISELLFLV